MAKTPDWVPFLEAGMEFTEMTRAEARRRAQRLVKEGQLAQDRAQAFVDEMVESSRRRAEELVDVVRTEFQRQVDALGLATKDDLAALEAKIDSKKSKDKKHKDKKHKDKKHKHKDKHGDAASKPAKGAKKAKKAKKTGPSKATVRRNAARKGTTNKGAARKGVARKGATNRPTGSTPPPAASPPAPPAPSPGGTDGPGPGPDSGSD